MPTKTSTSLIGIASALKPFSIIINREGN
jgi:hypothetical protein